MNGWAALDDVHVTSQGPFAVGFVVWRDARGRLVCTVVAKAAYKLVPGESAPLDVTLPLQEEDGHWDDDPSKSVHVPGDLAPFKTAAEIVVVGSAFAPEKRPAKSVTASVVVGSVDKSLEAWTRRRRRADGSIEDGPSLLRFSLRYENAAGGPGTDNPAGIDLGRADARGSFLLPQLLPPLHELGSASDHVPIVGFGPIASTSPLRMGRLGPQERAWLRDPAASPLPQSFPARFFQAAPADQWLDRALAANERIVLERLHAAHPRLVTCLSGLEPRAIVVGASGEQIRLSADLLVVDTDRALATLTFRAPVLVGEDARSLRIVVVGVPMGAELSPDAIRHALESRDDGESVTTGHWSRSDPEVTASSDDLLLPSSPALPFGPQRPAARRALPSDPGNAMPFRSAPPRAAPSAEAEPRASPHPTTRIPPPPPSRPEATPASAAPSAAPSTPAPPAIVWPASVAAPRGAPPSAEVDGRPSRASAPGLSERRAEPVAPRAAETSSAPTRRASEPPASFGAAFGGPSAKPSGEASGAPKGFGAAFKGAKAASDAAAHVESGREPARNQPPQKGASRSADEPPRRLAVVDLLHFEPRIAPRLRGMKIYARLWIRPVRARAPQAVDDPVRPTPTAERDRADVLWVLSCGRAVDAPEIRTALADSLDDLEDLELPIVLVAGELRPLFDEVEALRAAISVAQPLAGTDKKLLAAIAVAQGALAVPPRPETVLGLARQIEQASLGLSLPPRYLATEVERLLLESRKFKRRTLLGAARVRADLVLARGAEVLPLYLPDAIAASLPLLLSYPVVALCEVRPREDAAEAHAEALVSVALGRVVHRRAEE